MPRLDPVSPENATGATEEIYDRLKQKMGMIINIFQGMGNSPAALNAYISMSAALSEGGLSPVDREIVYLAVSERNGCHYCVSAHTLIATTRAGMTPDEVLDARKFEAADASQQALLHFVQRVIETNGFVSDDELSAVREAGYSDGQIAEAIGFIGLATFSNLFNHVNDTDLDFPAAPKL